MGRYFLAYCHITKPDGHIDKTEEMKVLLNSMTEEMAESEAKELWKKVLSDAKAQSAKKKKVRENQLTTALEERPFSPRLAYERPIGV